MSRLWPAALASLLASCAALAVTAPLRAAECYLMLGLYEEAVSGIESALTLAVYADDPSAVIQHLEVLVEALDKASGETASTTP